MAWRFVPAHVNETTEPVDNLGGILSAVLVGTLILAINFAPVPNMGALVIGLAAICVAATIAFVIRQRRTKDPLYDLDIAARPIFWVAAVAGIIVFGSLMGAMFIGQQYLQNVLELLDPRGRHRDHPGGPRDGHRGAALGRARRGQGRSVHAPVRVRVRASSAS